MELWFSQRGFQDVDILLESGLITRIGKGIEDSRAHLINASNLLVGPGLSTSMFIYESQGETGKIFLPEVELQHEEDSRQ